MIKTEKIVKKYGKIEVLKSIDIDLGEGQVAGLMGPNGSGKSTLLKSVLGLVIPDSGNIFVNGVSIKNKFDYRKFIGYMPQIANYPENLKVRELFKIVKDIRSDKSKYDYELFENFGLGEIENKYFGQLSGGYKQRVTASIAFLFEPEILILDEPTSSLDPVSTEILKDKIIKSGSEGRLVVICSHLVSEINEMADRLIYLIDGKILFNDRIKNLINGSGETLGKSIKKIIQNKIGSDEHKNS
ncbi:MAG: ABC transporter ATP-binding protein [Bacteroidetes bacterium]|nr:ABC transporter ATP-binding protein [Bacteroidota bacterium]